MVDEITIKEIRELSKSEKAGDRYIAAGHLLIKKGDSELGMLHIKLGDALNSEDDKMVRNARNKLNKLMTSRPYLDEYIDRVRDSEVQEMSNGEVTETTYDINTMSYMAGGLYDPRKFGGEGRVEIIGKDGKSKNKVRFGKAMGHIQLPIHVVLPGDYPLVAKILKISKQTVEDIGNYKAHVIIDSGIYDDCKKGDVLYGKKYDEARHKHPTGVKYRTGGEALWEMLLALDQPGHPERIAFGYIPVIAPAYRPTAYLESEMGYDEDEFTTIYHRIIGRSERTKKVLEINGPEFLYEEFSKSIEEAVEELMVYTDIILNEYVKREGNVKDIPVEMVDQLIFLRRERRLDFEKPVDVMTRDIERPDIYPKTVWLKKGDTKERIDFESMFRKCQEVYRMYTDREIMQMDTDDVRLRKHDRMGDVVSDIPRIAMRDKESMVVIFDEDLGMYVPAVTV